MRITLAFLLAAPLLAAAAIAPAGAATRTYTLTSFDRIRVEGPYAVTLATSVAPYARAVGPQVALDSVSLRVEGQTLYVRTDQSAVGADPARPAGPVTITLGTHDLTQASLNGAGSLTIDRARGLNFSLLVSGAGSVAIAKSDVDNLRVSVIGSGSARVAGSSQQFSGLIRGPGLLDASALATHDATLSAFGPATLRANVRDAAKVSASGTAVVTLDGQPACILKVVGSASVTGCK